MSDTNLSGVFVLQEVRERILAGVWPITAPGITTPITNLSTINEGGSVIVNVGTSNYEGQTLYWTISGITGTIDSSDFTAISGSFAVQSNNFGTFTITTTEDVTTEGTESFVVQIRTDSTSGPIKATSGTITINDTSTAPTIPTHGYFAGGRIPGFPPTGLISRITFASDTSTAISRGVLSGGRYDLAAVGTPTNVWYNGGVGPSFSPQETSIVDRITFSSDSSTASVRGPLVGGRYRHCSVGNNNYGWIAGGSTRPVPVNSRIERIDFNDDTITASTRGNLNNTLNAGAISNDNYGWFGGGYSPGNTSRINRIDFATDTGTPSARGPLSLARTDLTAVEDITYGWFAGGIGGSPSVVTSIIDRITFASDTTTASSRGKLSLARRYLSGSDDNTFGWFGGGNSSVIVSRVDRLTFSSDTSNASSRGSLDYSKWQQAGTEGVGS